MKETKENKVVLSGEELEEMYHLYMHNEDVILAKRVERGLYLLNKARELGKVLESFIPGEEKTANDILPNKSTKQDS